MSHDPEVVIVGAGPYGLSIAAHLRFHGVGFRLFGKPLSVWRNHMPEGMYLKSDGFASNLSDPASHFTLKYYCRQAGIPYHDTAIPVGLETFIAYGDAFQHTNAPTLENVEVIAIRRESDRFRVQLATGEIVDASQVIVATGVSRFPFIPAVLEKLPFEHLTHSYAHRNVDGFCGKEVTVVGGGASAMDLAALLHERGAKVTILARASRVQFNDHIGAGPRSFVQRVRYPSSGIGPSLQGWFYSNYPQVFHAFPAEVRLRIVRSFLGPAAGWTVKRRVVGRVPIKVGMNIRHAALQNGALHLQLTGEKAGTEEHVTEHLIAATGYRVDLRKLTFLSDEIRSQLRVHGGSPVLSRNFQSSVPGLYFVGLAAANSFGPVLRFTFGADFAARTIAQHFAAIAQPRLLRSAKLEELHNISEYDSAGRS